MCATLFEFRAFFKTNYISCIPSFLLFFSCCFPFGSILLCATLFWLFVQTPLRVFLSSHLEIIRFSFLTQVYIPWHILRALYSFLGPFLLFSGWKDTKSAVYTDRITLPTFSADSLSRCLYYVLIFDKRTGDRLHCGKTKRQTRAASWERGTIFFL